MDNESFQEYYKRYKSLMDECIPKEVLERLLNRAKGEIVRGDAWEEIVPWENN
jgi:histone H3/H4